MKQAILLSKNDNVATLLSEVNEGEQVEIKGVESAKIIISNQKIPMGHKIAIERIGDRNKIIKYDNVIGIATQNIQKGDHVHIQNVASNRTESNPGGEKA